MFKKRYFRLLLLVLLLLLTLGYLVVSQQARLIDQGFRPFIVSLLEESLDAEVSIGGLRVSRGIIYVANLTVSSPENYEFSATELQLPLDKDALLRRELSLVRIEQPLLQLFEATEPAPAREQPFDLPFSIASLDILNGTFIYSTEKADYRIANVSHQGSLSATSTFNTTANLGDSEGPPLSMKGSVAMRDKLLVTLEEVVLDEKVHLAEKMKIFFMPDGVSFSARIITEDFKTEELQRILKSVDIDFAWMEATQFHLAMPELFLSSQNGLLDFSFKSSSFDLDYENKKISLDNLNVTGRHDAGSLELTVQSPQSRIVQEDLSVSLGGLTLTAAQLANTWKMEASSETSHIEFQNYALSTDDLRISYDEAAGGGQFTIASAASQAQYEANHFALKNMDFTASQTDGAWRANGIIELEDYFSEDGLSAITGGVAEIKGSFNLPDENRTKVTGELDLFIGADEILYNSLYAELKGEGARVTTKGQYKFSDSSFDAQYLRVSLADLGRGDFKGTIGPTTRLAGKFTVPDIEKTFQAYIKNTFSELVPDVDTVQIQGTLDSEINLTLHKSNWDISGFLKPEKLSAHYPAIDLDIVNLSGSIPFALQSTGLADRKSAALQSGTINYAGFKLGVASLLGDTILLESESNKLNVTSPLEFDIAGGIFSVSRLDAELSETGLEFKTRAHLADIQLEELTMELGLPLMKGVISGDLGEISYAAKRISSGGEILINIFDGQILMSDLAYQDPFSAYSKLAADISIRGIDLYQLTQTFAFGEINGILDGEIKGLELLGMTPVQFVADFETRDRGSRNISVKALSNIGIVAQGAMMGALQQGIYKFIDFYRYRKLGFHASLVNDVFRITGTALAGSNEYLIYGGIIPPKINMVAPHREIPFNEMLNRMQRIERRAGG